MRLRFLPLLTLTLSVGITFARSQSSSTSTVAVVNTDSVASISTLVSVTNSDDIYARTVQANDNIAAFAKAATDKYHDLFEEGGIRAGPFLPKEDVGRDLNRLGSVPALLYSIQAVENVPSHRTAAHECRLVGEVLSMWYTSHRIPTEAVREAIRLKATRLERLGETVWNIRRKANDCRDALHMTQVLLRNSPLCVAADTCKDVDIELIDITYASNGSYSDFAVASGAQRQSLKDAVSDLWFSMYPDSSVLDYADSNTSLKSHPSHGSKDYNSLIQEAKAFRSLLEVDFQQDPESFIKYFLEVEKSCQRQTTESMLASVESTAEVEEPCQTQATGDTLASAELTGWLPAGWIEGGRM
ncbi:hypothetical protein LTR37_009303 [Vermiconidia calcicola]|uniref:Uncharacterized protein n=1 Tax=Vermiconidia calcicola TaxID=1690605 RepID=A0ACC3N8N3_9PEZI|nr:hypothetical protein LTR37_009303 [Vermiconidia calcicola]